MSSTVQDETRQSTNQPRGTRRPSNRNSIARRLRRGGLLTVLTGGLLVVCIVAAGVGQVRVPPAEVLGSLLHWLGIEIGPLPTHPQGQSALWNVRFPRVLLGVLVGAALGCAGAVMQGVFGNPLAEPSVIGVSSGAAVGAFTVIVFGLTTFGNATMAVAAFIGGLLTTLLVYGLSRTEGRTDVVTMILTGISVNALAGAVIGFFTFLADDDVRTTMAFWNLGSLNRALWPAVWVVLGCVAVGLAVSFRDSRRLDLLSLGERSARHLGVDVERLRLRLVITAALLTAAGVAFTGVIGFVGLVVPHVIRLIAGPGHRLLLPASALGGALVVVGADLLARNLIEHQELPLGVLTALVGGPFFLWLIRKSRTGPGGWA
ncbi:FecCD family ABC transporter permease [Actinoalloteichus hymeniacidonis]|uniref:FecCD family ABC transporter permease n=1 Tax=Actinoalloteichus hymeniacidonis TaxID=340345 RepID=UPI0009FECF9C|nr:iron ABC transporter permease [Actinoalloteichus hymeniacidonis]MBB5905819.1 iron complex transport system permease protein [Actinoalloteichus hymeniacidonis]